MKTTIKISGEKTRVLEHLTTLKTIFPKWKTSNLYANKDDDGVHLFMNEEAEA